MTNIHKLAAQPGPVDDPAISAITRLLDDRQYKLAHLVQEINDQREKIIDREHEAADLQREVAQLVHRL